jgi:hypothetical protein
MDLRFAGAVLDLAVTNLDRADAFTRCSSVDRQICGHRQTSENGVYMTLPKWRFASRPNPSPRVTESSLSVWPT